LITKQQKVETTIKTIRDWKKYSQQSLKEALSTINWSTMENTNDVITLNDRLKQTLKTALDKTAPWRTVRLRGQNQVEDLNIKWLKNRRDKCYQSGKVQKMKNYRTLTNNSGQKHMRSEKLKSKSN